MKLYFLRILFLIFGICSVFSVSGQENDNQTLFTFGKNKVSKAEFLNIYQKNNLKGEVIDRKSLEEYLELYINFKLKVKEAEEMGMDTMESFVTELSGYRSQLAQPYLVDKEITETIIKEAYNRMLYDIRASHILIKLDKDAFPHDTLVAYKKAMEIRKRLLNGEDFGKVAMEVSDDPSARQGFGASQGSSSKGNEGDLGYFTAFDMIYPFETGAYTTAVGQVSNPVRSDYGYHLIKVTDKKEALGRAQIAHIHVMIPANASHQDSLDSFNKIKGISQQIKTGTSFETAAQDLSDDKGSGPKGGVLPAFNVNRMVPEIIQIIAKMNVNDVSDPVLTVYGWHIIKLIDRQKIGIFEELQPQIKKRVSKDSRSQLSQDIAIKNIKKEYGFKENTKSINAFYAVVDSTILTNSWTIEKAAKLKKKMFTIGDKTYSQQDFAKYIFENQLHDSKQEVKNYVNSLYKNFVNQNVLLFKDSKLESLYPEFKMLMQEYRDGILLFDLTDNKVWSKAIKDSIGLVDFFEKNKENYMWGNRLDAELFTCTDSLSAINVMDLLKKKLSIAEIVAKLNEPTQVFIYEEKKYSENENPVIDKISWEKADQKMIKHDGKFYVVVVKEKVGPQPKKLDEARGIITSDYQKFLEEEWIQSLRTKYPIIVNREVFESILK